MLISCTLDSRLTCLMYQHTIPRHTIPPVNSTTFAATFTFSSHSLKLPSLPQSLSSFVCSSVRRHWTKPGSFPFTLCTLNIRSIFHPLHSAALSDLIDTHNPDLFCLTETWIKPTTTAAELLNCTPPHYAGWRRGVVVSGVRQWTKLTHAAPGYNWDGWPSSGGYTISGCNQPTRSTQPCIPPGSLNRVPASAGVKAGMSPLPGSR